MARREDPPRRSSQGRVTRRHVLFAATALASVAVGIGWSWGKGTLTYQGKKYPVKVEGLSVGELGVTRASARGEVFDLKKLADFDGTYTAGGAGATVGGGAGATIMRNQNGVVIEMTSTTQGASLKLAAQGLKVMSVAPGKAMFVRASWTACAASSSHSG